VNIKQTKNLFLKLNSNHNINYCDKLFYISEYKVNIKQTKNLFLKLNSNYNINYCGKLFHTK
jgi:hypothetical protein